MAMDDANCGRSSEKLTELTQRLRHYQCNYSSDAVDVGGERKESRIGEDSVGESVPRGVKSSRAAVLICLFEDEIGGLRVILTKRASTMSSHSGEVALPGGRRDETDSGDVETALREAKEEIGLDSSIVEVVTVLQPFHTKRGIAVSPVVGIMWDKRAFKPFLNADEVESLFDAPLEMFLKDENRRQEEREWMGNKYLLHFFEHRAKNGCYVIWALTAGILIKVASIVYQRSPAFEECTPEFWSGHDR